MKGSTTIEMAYTIPVVFLIFMVAIYTTFYLYDKNILCGVAYETAVIGSNQYGTEEGVCVEELEEFIRNQCARELIFFSQPSIEIVEEEDGIEVQLRVQKGKMGIRAEQAMPFMDQESYIRKIERLKGD